MAYIREQWIEELNELFKGKEETVIAIDRDEFVLEKNNIKSMIEGVFKIYAAYSKKNRALGEQKVGELRKLFLRPEGRSAYTEMIFNENFRIV